MLRKLSLPLVLVVANPSAAGALPIQADDCAGATVIAGCGLFPFDTSGATLDGAPDSLCDAFGSQQIDHDVWYAWTAPADGDYSLLTCLLTGVDTRLAVYLDTGTCPPPADSALACDDDLACSVVAGPSRVELVGATSGTGYLVRLGTFPGAPGGTGELSIEGCATGPGVNYCQSTANSTGTAATMSAAGSTSIFANDLVLCANDVPQSPGIGIFIAGASAQQVPLFDGFLCIGMIGLKRICELTPPDPSGKVTQRIDYTGVSTGTVPLDVLAGASYFYQYWFRDPLAGGTDVSLTDGLEIVHTP